MQPNERRRRIIEILNLRRQDTMQNLANEFGVCPLLPGLRHPRPAGTGRAGDRLRRPHRPRHGQPPAF